MSHARTRMVNVGHMAANFMSLLDRRNDTRDKELAVLVIWKKYDQLTLSAELDELQLKLTAVIFYLFSYNISLVN